jgi:hypothetical protein
VVLGSITSTHAREDLLVLFLVIFVHFLINWGEILGFWGVLVNWVRSLPLRLELDQDVFQKKGKLHTFIEDPKGRPLLLLLEDFMKDYFS